MKNELELRMYGFVPYNISEIQKGIQFGHAVVEYALENFNVGQYLDWAKYWKTFIILNGGTSNHSMNRYHHDENEYQGTMEDTLEVLMLNEVNLATFYEPDLNDMLSAIVFIIDERVFNRKDYPDFGDWVMTNHFSYLQDNMMNSNKIEKMRKDGYFLNGSDKERKLYSDWVDFVGGEKNAFLRDFLNPNKVKLA
jgi:hypothetical protein